MLCKKTLFPIKNLRFFDDLSVTKASQIRIYYFQID